jgi:hypothetical protein
LLIVFTLLYPLTAAGRQRCAAARNSALIFAASGKC